MKKMPANPSLSFPKFIFPLIVFWFFISALLFGSVNGMSASVPVAPNEAILTGIVSGYCVKSSRLLNIAPEQTIYQITVSIKSTDDIKGKPNFMKSKVGEDIVFHTKEIYPADIFGKRIKARARYQGDEKGGIYWIGNIELIRKEQNGNKEKY